MASGTHVRQFQLHKDCNRGREGIMQLVEVRVKVLKLRDLEFRATTLGFKPVRQCGSHVRWKHPDGRATTIPNHSEIYGWLLKKILRELGDHESGGENG